MVFEKDTLNNSEYGLWERHFKYVRVWFTFYIFYRFFEHYIPLK